MTKPSQKDPTKQEPLLDHEDWLYVTAVTCIALGVACYDVRAGLIALGTLLIGWPLMARLCAPRRDAE